MRLALTVSVKATLRPGAGCGRAMRAPTDYGRSVWRAEIVARAILACRGRRVLRGEITLLLTLWGGRAAQQNRDLPLRAQRALKEGVVIRKRQGEPSGSPSSCARGGRAGRISPRSAGTYVAPFSRNAPIGRAMRAPTGCDHRTACSPACHRQKEENPIGFPSSCARGGRAGRIPP